MEHLPPQNRRGTSSTKSQLLKENYYRVLVGTAFAGWGPCGSEGHCPHNADLVHEVGSGSEDHCGILHSSGQIAPSRVPRCSDDSADSCPKKGEADLSFVESPGVQFT